MADMELGDLEFQTPTAGVVKSTDFVCSCIVLAALACCNCAGFLKKVLARASEEFGEAPAEEAAAPPAGPVGVTTLLLCIGFGVSLWLLLQTPRPSRRPL